jgi:hypothetical protein
MISNFTVVSRQYIPLVEQSTRCITQPVAIEVPDDVLTARLVVDMKTQVVENINRQDVTKTSVRDFVLKVSD